MKKLFQILKEYGFLVIFIIAVLAKGDLLSSINIFSVMILIGTIAINKKLNQIFEVLMLIYTFLTSPKTDNQK